MKQKKDWAMLFRKKMRNKSGVAVLLAVTLMCAILSAVCTGYFCRRINDNTNRKMGAVIEAFLEAHPETDEMELIEILSKDTSDGKTLAFYGIDEKRYPAVKENRAAENAMCLCAIGCVLLLGAASFCQALRTEKKKKRRIEEITGYLRRINAGDDTLDVYDNSEDGFSLLKNEIYKTAVREREQRENAEKGRIAIKDALSDISHQLKTPLTSISIMTEILEEETLSEKGAEFIEDIKTELLKVRSLVTELLKLARFDADTVAFKRERCSLGAIVEDAKKDLSALAEKAQVSIEVLSASESPLYCDKKWQKEAFLNIMKNCVEHSREGQRVLVRIEGNRIYTEAVISDEAGGMCEKDRKHIFERFYKGQGASEESCGIGMHLAKTLIEKDGGTISVSSKEGAGSRFTVRYFHSGMKGETHEETRNSDYSD